MESGGLGSGSWSQEVEVGDWVGGLKSGWLGSGALELGGWDRGHWSWGRVVGVEGLESGGVGSGIGVGVGGGEVGGLG